MSTRAYIFVETAVGKTIDVLEHLRNIPSISSVDAVTGPYDIIAILEADNLNSVGDLVTGEIHTISGVIRTITCLSVRGN
jgi:DNA-binding Lrp family transcriptional regulator